MFIHAPFQTRMNAVPQTQRHRWPVVVAVVVVMLLVLAAAIWWFTERWVAGWVEAELENSLGLSLRAEAEVSLFPGLQIRFRNAELSRRTGPDPKPLFHADEGMVEVALLPLFQRQLRVRKLTLVRPSVTLPMSVDSGLGFTIPAQHGGRAAVAAAHIAVRDATLYLVDTAGKEILLTEHCDLELQSEQGGLSEASAWPAFKSRVTCGELRHGEIHMSELSAAIVAHSGIVAIDPLILKLSAASSSGHAQDEGNEQPDSQAAGRGQGRVKLNFTGPEPRYEVEYHLNQVAVEPLLQDHSDRLTVTGVVDMSLNLSLAGSRSRQLKETAAGTLSVHGTALTLEGIDLNRWLADIEDSRRFGVVDVGALVLGGPLGLVLSQGYDFARLASKVPGRSVIRQLISTWQFEKGMAEAIDVAFTTQDHRLAVQGKIDLVEERYENLTVALVDSRGCPILQQVVKGSILHPQLEQENALVRAVGPVVELAKEIQNVLRQDDCKPFYRGSLVRSE